MEAYPREFRLKVLSACDAGGSVREVACSFAVSESWVRRIKQARREQGKIAPKATRNRRKSWEPYTDWLLAKLGKHPGLYLRELQALAHAELGWEVSAVTLSRACRELKRRRIKRSLVAPNRKDEVLVEARHLWPAEGLNNHSVQVTSLDKS